MGIIQDQILEYYGLQDARKNDFGHQHMEGKAFGANLAILNPMVKMVHRSGMWFGRYRQVAPTVEI